MQGGGKGRNIASVGKYRMFTIWGAAVSVSSLEKGAAIGQSGKISGSLAAFLYPVVSIISLDDGMR